MDSVKIYDRYGNPIEVGSLVAYATASYRQATLRTGVVREIILGTRKDSVKVKSNETGRTTTQYAEDFVVLGVLI